MFQKLKRERVSRREQPAVSKPVDKSRDVRIDHWICKYYGCW